MTPPLLSRHLATFLPVAVKLCRDTDAEAVLVLLEGPTDWQQLRSLAAGLKVIVAGDNPDEVAGAAEHQLFSVVVGEKLPIFEKLTKAVLEAVSRDVLPPGAEVVALYSGFEPGEIDSVSFISLDEHLGRLTARDLRKLETSVPLDTLKTVIDLAVDIGREGREGKPVGSMFVIGDTRKVMQHSRPAGFDPVKGYARHERDLNDPRVREAIKEIAQLDGAFLVSAEGIVERACQLVDTANADVTVSAGLGARHWAAAAISKSTKSIAVVVSESSGTVRLFQNGEVVLRIEPMRRPMKWKGFENEAVGAADKE